MLVFATRFFAPPPLMPPTLLYLLRRQIGPVALLTNLLTGVLFGLGLSAVGQEIPSALRSSLAARIDSQRQSLNTSLIPQIATADEKLQKAFWVVEDYLKATTDSQNAARWMEYFHADKLIMTEPVPVEMLSQRGLTLRDTYWRLARNVAGLEREPVVRLRNALQESMHAILFRDSQRTAETIERQLGQVAELLRSDAPVLSAEDSARLNRLLHFISSSQLAPQVVAQLHESISQPNVAVHIGQPLLEHWLNRPVARTRPSDECILGTRVLSTVHLQGEFRVRLLPSHEGGQLLLGLHANMSSQGTGYQRSVQIKNRSSGNVFAQRLYTMTENGGRVGPVSADASINSEILGVQHPLKIVRKIGTRKANEAKPQANAISAVRLETRTANEFQQETDAKFALNSDAQRQRETRTILQRLDLSLPKRHWASTSDYLQLRMTVAEPEQVTTWVPAPPVSNGHFMLVQVHESLVDNLAAQLLAERTLRDSELESFAKGLFPQLATAGPPARSATANNSDADLQADEPLSITFSALRPIIFEAREGRIRVGLRGSRFVQGERVLDKALEITAAYKIENLPSGTWGLVREGKVEVNFPGGERRLSIPEVALRSNIEKRFATVFPEQLFEQPIDIPPLGTGDNASNGHNTENGDAVPATLRLRPRSIEAADGWFTVAL